MGGACCGGVRERGGVCGGGGVSCGGDEWKHAGVQAQRESQVGGVGEGETPQMQGPNTCTTLQAQHSNEDHGQQQRALPRPLAPPARPPAHLIAADGFDAAG